MRGGPPRLAVLFWVVEPISTFLNGASSYFFAFVALLDLRALTERVLPSVGPPSDGLPKRDRPFATPHCESAALLFAHDLRISSYFFFVFDDDDRDDFSVAECDP